MGEIGSADRRTNGVRWAGATLAASCLLLAGCSGSGSSSSSESEAPTATPVLKGTLTLVGGGGYTEDDPCYGTANSLVDNSDLKIGAPIRVLDASGTIIGTTPLPGGVYHSIGNKVNGGSACVIEFSVPLDAESKHYQITIGGRDPYDFDSLAVPLDLVLGGS